MSHIKNTSLTRYQNPEVFEQLAIEYAVGSLHGRARKRFEVLMDTHFYLQATVEAYEHKFAHLVELLPDEKPSNSVWIGIDAHIKSSPKECSAQETKMAWWKNGFFKQGFGMAMMALVVSAVLLLNPDTGTPVATAYSAILESGTQIPMAVTKIEKSSMKLSIDIMKPVAVADGMELTLWCHPRDGGMPMKMGVISKEGKTEISISKEEWISMQNVGMLAISIEKKDSDGMRKPTGDVILKGKLSSAG